MKTIRMKTDNIIAIRDLVKELKDRYFAMRKINNRIKSDCHVSRYDNNLEIHLRFEVGDELGHFYIYWGKKQCVRFEEGYKFELSKEQNEQQFYDFFNVLKDFLDNMNTL